MGKILIIGGGAMGSAFSIPCLENNNQFEIEIHHNLGYFDFVTTLIHELVHVDQTLRGLFDDQKRENEAYVLEKKLGKKFMLENEPCKVS